MEERSATNPLQERNNTSERVYLPYKPAETEGECTLVYVSPLKFVLWRFVLFVILSICLVGIPLLFVYWYPILERYFYYRFCSLQECTDFLIKNQDQSYSVVQREKRMYFQTEQKSVQVDCFEQRYLNYNVNASMVKVGMFDYYDRINRIMGPSVQPSQSGLTQFQAQNLQSYYGPGTMVIKKPGLIVLLFREVFRPLYLFLVFSVSLWTYEAYYYYAGVIFFTSAVAIIVQLYQVNALNQKIYQMAYHETKVHVLREGKVSERSSLQLVPGDITFIRNPQKVPYDGVLLEGSVLINQCALTGQSVPIVKKATPALQFGKNKQADKSAYVFEGTTIIQVNDKKSIGRFQQYRKQFGLPVCVIRTNFITMKGQLIRLISFPKETQNKFQKQSSKFLIFLFILSVSTYIFLIIKLHDVVEAHDLIVKFFDLITITVPPGLPISMTVGIVFALQKLKAKEIYCISPDKVIVGGSVNYVCFDKTGTLTQDFMNFHSLIPCKDANFLEPIDENSKKSKPLATLLNQKPYLNTALSNMACNHSVVKLEETAQLIGDPMETNLLQFGQYHFGEAQSDPEIIYTMKSSYSPNFNIYRRFEFDADLQRMGVVAQLDKTDSFSVYVKGSPQVMRRIMKPSSIPQDYSEMLSKYASMGLRVLTIASKDIKTSKENLKSLSREQVQAEIIFDGFQVFENKLKLETAAAIQELFDAEVPCVMITGDNALTGSNIAYKCCIASYDRKMKIIDVSHEGKLIEQEFKFDEMEQTKDMKRTSNEKKESMYEVEMTNITKGLKKNTISNLGNSETEGSTKKENKQSQEFLISMLMKAKQSKYQFCLTGAAFNKIFPGQIKEVTEVEAMFISQVRVFARAKPNDKARIIMVYQALGKTTAMCGDGANDCGALKQADVGLSLSQAQASISSPFTSKIANISSMVQLLKECRAGLATNFSLFNIMAMYSLVQYTTTVISQYYFAYPADFQYLYWDIGCNFFFFLVIGYTATADNLCIERPSASLFALSNLLQVVIMAIIQVLGQITILLALGGIFAEPTDYYNNGSQSVNEARYLDENDGFLIGTPETNSLFLFVNFMYLYSLLAFMISKPWRKEFFTNIPLMIILLIVFTYSTVIVVVPEARLEIFMITDQDYLPFNGFILGMANLFGIVMFINQKYILQVFFAWLKKIYPQKTWI